MRSNSGPKSPGSVKSDPGNPGIDLNRGGPRGCRESEEEGDGNGGLWVPKRIATRPLYGADEVARQRLIGGAMGALAILLVAGLACLMFASANGLSTRDLLTFLNSAMDRLFTLLAVILAYYFGRKSRKKQN